MEVKSTVNMNWAKINQLTRAAVTALEETAEALHTEVVQAQVMPFDDPQIIEKKVYGKRGQFAKNGREYKGKIIHEKVHGGGHLQNEATFVDYSDSRNGKVTIASNTPYARRLYYHPEYHFDKGENPHAGGEWYKSWISGGSKANFAKNTFKVLYRKNGGL
ncbi:hypothetical protein ACTNEN_09560 [Oribacterium sp. HCP28S3_H8]|uniref:hypothetical protein n=1 Tax=Oribacterium sp. HCP28S3_H8 TaxID=3438945 RepID=UPI003F891D8F